MNKVILIWNITKEVEIKQTTTWIMALTSIATNEFYKDKQWEKQQQTDFHNLTAFWKTAEFFEKYIQKWQKILIEGKIKTNSYDGEDWKKKYSTYVLVEKVEFLGGGQKKEEEINDNEIKEVFNGKNEKKSKNYNDISVEDIPFN